MNDKQVNVDVRADVRKFESDMASAEKSVKDFKEESEKIEAPMMRAMAAAGNMATKIAGAAAVIVSVYGAAVLAATKHTIDLADGIGKLSERLGYGVPQMHAYVLAAERANVPQEQLAQGLRMFNQRIDEAMQGSKEASSLFSRLGIDLSGLRNGTKNVNDIFLEFVDRMAHMEGGAGKTRIATLALGDSGERLIPMFKEGAIGLKSVGDEAARTGGLLDKEAADGADKFNTKVVELKQNIGLLGIALTKDFVGPLGDAVGTINDAIKSLGIMNTLLPRQGQPSWSSIANPGARVLEIEKELAELKSKGPNLDDRINKFFGFEVQTDGQVSVLETELKALKAIQNLKLARESQNSIHRVTLPAPDSPDPPTKGTGKNSFAQVLAKAERDAEDAYYKYRVAQEKELQDVLDELAKREKKRVDDLTRSSEKGWKEYYENTTERANEYARMLAEVNRKQTDSFADLKDSVEGWGRSFSRTMGEAVITGNLTARSIGDAFQNLAIEIASKQIQKRVTDPLVSLGTSFLDAILGGSSSLVPVAERPTVLMADPPVGLQAVDWEFAGGGVMTSRGAMPLRRYSRGGIANRPQLAMFGEGDNPEAYVPLPDGRRIPVAMQGGGQSIVVRIENTGSPKEVTQAQPTVTPEGIVVQVFTSDLMTGGPISQAMERAYSVGRSVG